MKTLQLTRTLYLALLAGFFLTACDTEGILPCENGDGTRVSEARAETGFDKILLDLPGDVYITKGEDFSIDITAQQNIIDQIKTDVTGSLLAISKDRCIRSYKTIRIDITLPDISSLEVDGSGDIYVLDRFTGSNLDLFVKGSGSIDMLGDYQKIYQEVDGSGDINMVAEAIEIETRIKGAGDVFLSGTAELHDINLNGSGNLESFEMLTESCDVRIEGSGDADIHVTNDLNVRILGSGDVRYKGNPSVDANITGSGKLESVN